MEEICLKYGTKSIGEVLIILRFAYLSQLDIIWSKLHNHITPSLIYKICLFGFLHLTFELLICITEADISEYLECLIKFLE